MQEITVGTEFLDLLPKAQRENLINWTSPKWKLLLCEKVMNRYLTGDSVQMVEKHRKTCSIALPMKWKLKPQGLPIHTYQIGWKNNNTTTTQCWQGGGKIGWLIYSWWECNMVQPLWKTVVVSLKNEISNIQPAVSFLGIYDTEMKTFIPTYKKKKKNCIWIFIALFKIAKTWKPDNMGEWLNKRWYFLHMMEYCLAIKRN